jgi:hypothetical protein
MRTNFLKAENISMLKQPLYSPDLYVCDFFLFVALKKKLKKVSIWDKTDLKKKIENFMKEMPKELSNKVFEKLNEKLQKCIDNEGNYIE